MNKASFLPKAIPAKAGVGLRTQHYKDLVQQKPDIGFIEVHPENYISSPVHQHHLEKAREIYPLSFHAIGLSLGADQPVNHDHLKKIKMLIDRFQPDFFSDHASWSISGNAHLGDLLPLPYTEEILKVLIDNIERTQDFLGRQMLVENPSTYLQFKESTMDEATFMNEAAKQSGCKLLLDVNNIYVQSRNHNFDPYAYINTIKPSYVGEMHLAGHTERQIDTQTILIDTHSKHVVDPVWDLYTHAIKRFGAIPTLIEWDDDIPTLETLVAEAKKADAIMDERQLHVA